VEAQLLGWGRQHLHLGAAAAARADSGRGGASAVTVGDRALLRHGLVEPGARRQRAEKFKRWERGSPNELRQLDVVGGATFKAVTGVDDHSRLCVIAALVAAAMRPYGVPQQVLTDTGKVFTARFHARPVEMLFDRLCPENGVEHLRTPPRSSTTTGKIERFHRSLRAEFLTGRVFASQQAAQAELDGWGADFNTHRPRQALGIATPAQRFGRPTESGTGIGRTGPDTGR
jgi:transposase InsO family protein